MIQVISKLNSKGKRYVFIYDALVTVFDFAFSVRSTESKEFCRQNPIKVAIFDFFVVLVLFNVEVVEIEKAVELSLFSNK